MRIRGSTVLVLVALFLVSCGTFPVNPRLEIYDKESGYRFDQLDVGENTDSLFVIVTFSGGGTRAAALSYGVLEALRDTRMDWGGRRVQILHELDVISSVSGGSFPAAYYALYRERLFDEFPDKFLYRPIQSELTGLLFSPGNWLKLLGSSYGRSDMAAAFYSREVFDGGTYRDVIAQRRRPFVILNSTDMTTGQQFSFIQDQFDLICSDLAGLPLGRAAAASSAFPGLLTPLTFQNFAGDCQYEQPPWIAQAVADRELRVNPGRTARAEVRLSYTDDTASRRDFIHLIDGGVADNIGLRGPLRSIRSINAAWSVLRKINLEEIDKLVVIVVNAATDPDPKRDKSAKVPGLIDTVTAAATVPIENFSFDTVDLLEATVNEFNEPARLIEGCRNAAARLGEQCIPDIPAPYGFDLYPIQVAFDNIKSTTDRNWFKNLPTNFELPRATVDKLRQIGRQLLEEDPQFMRLLQNSNGCMETAENPC